MAQSVNQSISGVLSIEDKILNQLQAAQQHLEALNKEADKLTNSLGPAKAAAEGLAKALNAIKMPTGKVDLGLNDANTNLGKLMNRIQRLDFQTPFSKASAAVKDFDDKLQSCSQSAKTLVDLAKQLGAVFNNRGNNNGGGGGNGNGQGRSDFEIELRNLRKQSFELYKMLTTLSAARSLGGLVKDAVEIRGEFEMAQRSLGFIINDIAKSEEIFSRIKELAIVSPFEVGDLVKQTRQLAAYGIETEKLADTTKRLGDIASGVGVDMGRLILAYGQVKAAQFLRLTEVRQFTEAGVDVLGGLAQYFSEVEHRAVSVGEVMTRITKKMVTFSDVEVVLNRLTSAGGKFYKMQEKQADTIQGTISNLKDRWNIELNEFTSTYDGLIKGVLNMTQGLIGGLSFVAPALVSAFAGVAIGEAVVGVGKLINVVKTLGKVLTGALGATSQIGMIVAIVSMVASAIAMGIMQANKLKNELKEINREAETEAGNLEGRYRRLTAEIKNAADGSEVQRKALEQLRAEFGNIIPAIDLEAEALSNLTNKYDEHIQAIRNYVVEKVNQQRAEKLYSSLRETVQDEFESWSYTKHAAPDVEKAFAEVGIGAEEARSIIKSVFDTIAQELFDKKLSTNFASIQARMKNLFASYLGTSFSKELERLIDVGYFAGFVANLRKVMETFSDIGGADVDLNITRDQQQLNQAVRDMSIMVSNIRTTLKDSGLFADNAEQMDLAVDTILSIYSKVLKAKALNPNLDLSGFMEAFKNAIVGVKEMPGIKGVEDKTSAAFKTAVGNVDWAKVFATSADKIGSDWWKSINDALGAKKPHTSIEDLMIQRVDAALGQFDLTAIRKRLSEIIAEINTDYAALPIRLPVIQDRQALSDYAQTVYNEMKKVKGELKALDSSKGDTQLKELEFLSRFGGDKQKLADYAAAMERLWTALEPFYTPPHSGSGSKGKTPKDYLKELAEAVAAFPSNSANKVESEVQHLKDGMAELAKGAGVQFDANSVLASEDSIKNWLQSVQGRLDKGVGDKLIFKVGIAYDKMEVTELKRQANSLFTDYQLALGFEKNGVTIPGMDPSKIMQDIVAIEDKLRKVYGDEASAAGIGTKRLEIIKKNQEDIINLIAKKQVDVTQKAAGIIETATAEMRRMSGVNRNSGITGIAISDPTKSTAMLNTMKEALYKVGHEQYDVLRSSELYIESFNDLDKVSYKALSSLKNMLVQVKGSFGITPKDERAIEKQILKIEDRMGELGGGRKRTSLFIQMGRQYGEMNAGLKELGGNRDAYVAAIEARTAAQEELNRVTAQYREMKGLGADGALTAEQEQDLLSMQSYKDAVAKVADATEKADKATEAYMGSINRVKNAQKLLKTQIGKLQTAFSGMTDLVSESIELCEGLAEGFGVTFDDEHTEAIDAFLKGFDLMSKGLVLVAGGVTMVNLLMDVLNIKADELLIKLWPLAIVAAALGAAFAAIKIVDNNKKKKIEENLTLVENLTDRYEKLAEAMEAAGSVKSFIQNFEEANAALQQQLAALEEARRIEESRGLKKDEDELKDIEDKIADAYENQVELRKQFYKDLGSTDDWAKEADDWASAWLDAFKEGESGIASLRESMDKLLDDMVAKQLKLKVLSPMLTELQKAVESALDDGNITKDEWDYIQSIKENTAKLADSYMEQLAEQLGVVASKTQSDSNLSNSIQNITESTADALEALMNSQRYYSADTNSKVNELLTMLSDESGERNPVLAELREQTSVLLDIYRILNDNTKAGGHKLGGGGFKTFSTLS